MKKLVKIEIKKCLKRKEFILILLLIIIAVASDFALTIMHFYGGKTSQLLSAHSAIIIKNIIRTPLQPVFGVLLPLTVSIIGSDIYLEEQINGTENVINTRISKKDNIISKAIAISIISFFIVLIPLILNQILALIAFPIQGSGSFRETGYKQLIYIDKGIMLNQIETYYLYLNNIIFIIIRSICAVLFTLISYGFSFIPKINKYLAILSSFIVHTLLTTLLSVISLIISISGVNVSLAEAMRTDILGVNGYGNIYVLFSNLVVYLIAGILLINRGIKIKNEG